MTELAFLGLGVMGFPMAGYLDRAGHEVTVWNRTANVAERWSQNYSGRVANTAIEAVQDAEIVLACLGDDPDVLEVAIPVFEVMKAGALFVDHTTTSARLARKLNEQATKKEIGFVDAPVSGGQAGAENGQLTIMCGGASSAFETARPVMACYAKSIMLMGEAGAGQLTKMVNQICIAGVVQGLSEGLHFAEQAGLDPRKVFDVIGKGAAQSWQMDNRHQSMIEGEFEHGFAVDWMRKDLRVAMEEADANGAKLEMTRLVDGYYQQIQKMGGQRWDTSSLIQRLRKET